MIEYIGEHTLVGTLGQVFISTAFVAALLSAFSFYKASKNELSKKEWIPLARGAFYVHGLSVIGIIGCMFFMIYNHYFEYQYVWQHSSLSLPTHYMISCFWEGQEGSFLLWVFWNLILGIILIKKAKSWESPVLTVVATIQTFLSSMIIGGQFFGIKIGTSPFILVRNLEENIGLPWTKMANYLEVVPQFADGRGLNPLLQNYWMVIHQPVLFLGFALTMIPFCYAIAALWKKNYAEWVREALPWTYAAITVLGTGILMGGAWAYESLSFGGFWAWDPVENSSLVPWIILVAAAHLMLVFRAKKTALRTTFVLTLLSFLLVIYSSYLTRSGILGDTSVHAFAGGLDYQLLMYLISFTIFTAFILAIRFRNIPKIKKEEDSSSREFWMFIGSMVLFISAFQITWFTSLPVINKVLGTQMAPPLDAIDLYNTWQAPIAVVIIILIGLTQYLNYGKTDLKKFYKQLQNSIISSLALSFVIAFTVQMWDIIFFLLLWATVFAALSNFFYWRKILKGDWNLSGSSIAHIGFALVIMGALLSNANKNIISSNDGFIAKDFPSNENILLEKGDTNAPKSIPGAHWWKFATKPRSTFDQWSFGTTIRGSQKNVRLHHYGLCPYPFGDRYALNLSFGRCNRVPYQGQSYRKRIVGISETTYSRRKAQKCGVRPQWSRGWKQLRLWLRIQIRIQLRIRIRLFERFLGRKLLKMAAYVFCEKRILAAMAFSKALTFLMRTFFSKSSKCPLW